MQIEILCTGDEILTGKTVNTNYSYMARRLGEVGLTVAWGTTVGDDRSRLAAAILQAAARSDAVVVNGGLGPTVDDLSQEVAAEAAGVTLELDRDWMRRMENYYSRRGRTMPETNRKQAMLPAGATVIDNPVGTACGFGLSIAGTPFFFTPGVPREMRLMLDEQIIPRLLELSGDERVARVKRFHSFGIGESRADQLLRDVGGLAPGGDVKLGFQSHYPQLETKLTAHAASEAELERKLAPVAAEVRDRLGAFVLAEDDETVERRVLDALEASGGGVATMEMLTGGLVSSRLLAASQQGRVFRRGVVSRDLGQLADAAATDPAVLRGGPSRDAAVALARGIAGRAGASHGLVVLVSMTGAGEDCRGEVVIGIAADGAPVSRKALLVGSVRWIRLGAAELALDCLRRHLFGLPVDQRIDFELD